MAKKKRKTATFSSPKSIAVKTQTAQDIDPQIAAERFVGQWNRLVSTTNWEKGRIICQWREALMTSGAAVTEYSDEAWSQLVGGVTSQHVGRLRRVFQRFGADHDQYEGLYWSHFQAALEWDDAEMWLEGAIQNDWSVSQMRGKRWETFGTPPEQQQAETAADQLEFESAQEATTASVRRSEDTVVGGGAVATSAPVLLKSTVAKDVAANEGERTPPKDASAKSTTSAPEPAQRTRLKINVDNLPDDLAEAFESFKLAIIAHRREGWSETTPDEVVKCLDALRELALAE